MKQSTITLTHDNKEETKTFSIKYWSNYGKERAYLSFGRKDCGFVEKGQYYPPKCVDPVRGYIHAIERQL